MTRVFFALWPDDHVRGALAQLATGLRRECGGRAVPARNIHLTLAFIGGIETARLAQLRKAAASVVSRPFTLRVDLVAYWPRSRIVWAGPRTCPAALLHLASALGSALTASGFAIDERPYAPHITLLRNARSAPDRADAGGIDWQARDLALVRSVRGESGSRYEVIDRWLLGDQADPA